MLNKLFSRKLAVGSAVGVLICAALVGCGQPRSITFSEAKIIADRELADFCRFYGGLRTSDFTKRKYLDEKELSDANWWVFEYQFIGRRNAKILIGVGEYGGAEVFAWGPGIPRGKGKR
ncbi:MAG: hypothetical protein Q7T82_15825 [Armatimonadota bacterium]|nr:hypothetical protein [Armatimonadota bacterium]